jgi:Ca2+-binding RTX toxin-like protein
MANITGTNSANNLIGTAFADNIDARGGNDIVDAGDGDDFVDGGATATTRSRAVAAMTFCLVAPTTTA